MIGSLPNGSKF